MWDQIRLTGTYHLGSEEKPIGIKLILTTRDHLETKCSDKVSEEGVRLQMELLVLTLLKITKAERL
jgi:hypothetical protein